MVASVLAELQRELIVANTRDGLAAARARGRIGGRRPKLTQRQLDLAQGMYDEGRHTVEEIAQTFGVSRPTLYRHLSAGQDGRDCVLVVYRNTRKAKIDASNRRYGETGAGEEVQLEADRKWWPVAPARRSHLKAIVYVTDGTVTRMRAVDPDASAWREDDRGYADVPVGPPLTQLQIAERFPTLGLRLGDERPHVRGKLREYLTL